VNNAKDRIRETTWDLECEQRGEKHKGTKHRTNLTNTKEQQPECVAGKKFEFDEVARLNAIDLVVNHGKTEREK
jgi:hypothetical protein